MTSRDTLLPNGNYNKKTWEDEEIIYKEDLNTLEDIAYKNRESILELNNKIITVDDNVVANNKTWSSEKIEDFVLTNDDVVWTGINGENLSINYTKEGYLREVEIWGNTVQDENNLEDIQHLGELYVDDEGQPILDKLGREQYKVEIESCNKNLIPTMQLKKGTNFDKDDISNNIYRHFGYLFLPKSSYYIQANENVYLRNLNFSSGQSLMTINNNYKQFTVNEDCEISIYFRDKTSVSTVWNLGETTQDIQLMISNTNSKQEYVPNQSNKTTILLPCQLMKVGDVVDRLYWDSEKGKYVVEKNVYSTHFSQNQNWATNVSSMFYISNMSIIPQPKDNTNIISNTKSRVVTSIGGTQVRFMKVNEDSDYDSIENFKTSLPNGITLIYIANSPQLIETNINSQILLPTYKDKTHIFVTGGIDGSIKAKAPLDGGQAILSLSEENKELKEVNKEQAELINTTMLATDEMFSLLEPLLVNEINDLDSDNNPLINMYVAIVQRGLKDIEDISDKYKDQVRQKLTN